MKGASGRFKGKYDLFTIYLVPGATVLLASLDSWTGTNLSVLGNRTVGIPWKLDRHKPFCSWQSVRP